MRDAAEGIQSEKDDCDLRLSKSPQGQGREGPTDSRGRHGRQQEVNIEETSGGSDPHPRMRVRRVACDKQCCNHKRAWKRLMLKPLPSQVTWNDILVTSLIWIQFVP